MIITWANRAATVALSAALAAATTACTNDSGDDLPPPPSPARAQSPAPSSPSPTMDSEHAPIITAYEGYIRTLGEMANSGDPNNERILDYAEGVAAFRARDGIQQLSEGGKVYRGRQEVAAVEVTGIDHETRPPAATLAACLDAADYLLVNENDESPVPLDKKIERYSATAVLVYVGGRWLVSETDGDVEASC